MSSPSAPNASTFILLALLLGSLLASYCAVRLVVSARSGSSSFEYESFPSGSLPSHTPHKAWNGGIKLYSLRSCKVLSAAFYDDEKVEYDCVYVLQPRFLPLRDNVQIAFVTHTSRCGSTLFCRLLDARADVVTYREPAIVAVLMSTAATGTEHVRSHAIALLRGVFWHFMEHARGQGVRLAVVKLSSMCSRRDMLYCLEEVAPGARKVHITRHIEDIVRSHQKTQTISTATVSEFRAQLEQKFADSTAWADSLVPYESFSGEQADMAAVSSALGLSTPTKKQWEAMIEELKIDAKLGGLRPPRRDPKRVET